MAADFAQKFEQALRDKKEQDPQFGLRTLARIIAKDDLKQTEIVRRRLHKYRPKPSSGGAAESVPTTPTRHEIERALGLDVDALAPDDDLILALSPQQAYLRAERNRLEADHARVDALERLYAETG